VSGFIRVSIGSAAAQAASRDGIFAENLWFSQVRAWRANWRQLNFLSKGQVLLGSTSTRARTRVPLRDERRAR
jgi:hypothetical protein